MGFTEVYKFIQQNLKKNQLKPSELQPSSSELRLKLLEYLIGWNFQFWLNFKLFPSKQAKHFQRWNEIWVFHVIWVFYHTSFLHTGKVFIHPQDCRWNLAELIKKLGWIRLNVQMNSVEYLRHIQTKIQPSLAKWSLKYKAHRHFSHQACSIPNKVSIAEIE